jgi:hypothetical protein
MHKNCDRGKCGEVGSAIPMSSRHQDAAINQAENAGGDRWPNAGGGHAEHARRDAVNLLVMLPSGDGRGFAAGLA